MSERDCPNCKRLEEELEELTQDYNQLDYEIRDTETGQIQGKD